MEDFEQFILEGITGFLVENEEYIGAEKLLELHRQGEILPVERVDEETYIVKKNGQLVELMFAWYNIIKNYFKRLYKILYIDTYLWYNIK